MKDNKFKGLIDLFKANYSTTKEVGLSTTTSLEVPNEKSVVLYYRYYSNFKVYAFINNGKIDILKDSTEYCLLDELYSTYNCYSSEIEYINVLSEHYVYLTKTGIYSEGDDLRDQDSKLCDDIFFMLSAMDCLDKVIFITKRFNCMCYGFTSEYNFINKSKWSMSLVDKGFIDNRLSALLLPVGNSIDYDYVTDRLYTNPKELYLDLHIYCKKNDLLLSHCGDLGIQIAMK